MDYVTDSDLVKSDRAQYIEDYDIRDDRIHRPGKFEGERPYMPLAYEQYMDGCSNELDNGTIEVDFTETMKLAFPSYKRRKLVRFVIYDNGFVCEVR